jgi:hypothetical protein
MYGNINVKFNGHLCHADSNLPFSGKYTQIFMWKTRKRCNLATVAYVFIRMSHFSSRKYVTVWPFHTTTKKASNSCNTNKCIILQLMYTISDVAATCFDAITSPYLGCWNQNFFKTYSNKIGHNKNMYDLHKFNVGETVIIL